MSLLNPEFLWFLFPLLFLFKRAEKTPQSIWLLLSLSFLLIALARPVAALKSLEVDEAGSDVIIALDLSYSMQGSDIKPTRLERAKEILKKLVQSNDKDRFGILAYTTNAIVLSPLTRDDELLLHLFEGLDENLIITKGTNVHSALKLAKKMSKSPHLKVVLLTDGGDNLGYEEEAVFAKENKMQVNIMMLATAIGSTLTLNGDLLKDEDGDIVLSSANRAIETISQRSEGMYINSFDSSDLIDVLNDQREEDFKTKSRSERYEEYFYLFIVLALLSFIIAYTSLKNRLKFIILPIALLLGTNLEASLFDAMNHASALNYYEKKEFIKSAEFFEKIDSNQARYNRANAYYKSGEYEKAIFIYQGIKSSDIQFKATLYFNLGCAYTRLKEFEKAQENYLKSLTLQESTAARENLEYILSASAQNHLLTGQQEGKERAEDALQENSIEKQKSEEKEKRESAGSSNMKVDADASSGESKNGQEVEAKAKLNISSSKAKLSSKQYELINQRSVNEKSPW